MTYSTHIVTDLSLKKKSALLKSQVIVIKLLKIVTK